MGGHGGGGGGGSRAQAVTHVEVGLVVVGTDRNMHASASSCLAAHLLLLTAAWPIEPSPLWER